MSIEENESTTRTDRTEEEEMWEQCLQKDKQTICHASGWDFMQKISKKYTGTRMRESCLVRPTDQLNRQQYCP